MSVGLRVSGLQKSFGIEQIVCGVSFDVHEGEVVSILGPSGSGKTTLLRMVAGLALPDAGSLTLGEQVVYQDRPFRWLPPEHRGLGMVFQDFGLWPHLTVRDNVSFPLRYGRRAKARLTAQQIDERVEVALEAMHIGSMATKLPHQLSGGQQQRVAFARATVAQPKMLLLDEPFSALDRQLRIQLREELLSLLRERKLTVLHVTHDQEEALAMSDRILLMSKGCILQFDTPENLYHTPQGAGVAAFVGRSNLVPVTVKRSGTGTGIKICFPTGKTLDLDGGRPALSVSSEASMVAMIRPEDLVIGDWLNDPINLEDRHFSLTGSVDRIQFLGDRYMVQVAISGMGPLLCYTTRKFSEGACVYVRTPHDRVHLLADEGGLVAASGGTMRGRDNS